MRARKTLCSLILLACTGCLYTSNTEGGWGMFANTFRNLGEWPFYGGDQIVIAHRNRKLARRSWDEVVKGIPNPVSDDYAKGYQDGFADYLDAGGTGEPPPYPPACYRLSCWQTPEGQKAVQDWYAGFRHGAGMARASGIREAIVLPLSAPPARTDRPYRPVGAPPPKDDAVPDAPDAPAQLLPPRILP